MIALAEYGGLSWFVCFRTHKVSVRMELVRVCWGKDEVHLNRSEVQSLEALKERLQVVEERGPNSF